MPDSYNPDWRYANMTQTEIDYKLVIGDRVMYLNIMENKVRKTIRLHSITTKIQTTTTEK